ncbi:MAG: hypothetical protein ABIZ07_11115, partial [Dermatophilaceae bacterium]
MVPGTGPGPGADPATQQLVQDLRRTLRSDDPLDLLATGEYQERAKQLGKVLADGLAGLVGHG